jgi:hypothetical protein
VPLSVEVVSGQKLTDAGIVRLEDIEGYVPNVQITETGIANNIYIRGIGSGLNQGFEQSVSTYMDGIYRGGDITRPSWTWSGSRLLTRSRSCWQNAVAGAVSLVSAPTRDFEGLVRLVDFENEDMIGNLVLSGPLSDRFGARLAVHARDANGYVNNLTLDRDEPGRDELAARLTLDFDVSEALSMSWRTEAGSYDTRGRQIEIFGETPVTSGSLAGLTYSQIVGGPVPPFPQGQHPSARNNVIDFQRSSNGDSSDFSTFETALTLDYRAANDVTLTSVTGYSTYDLDDFCDCDFVSATVFNAGIEAGSSAKIARHVIRRPDRLLDRRPVLQNYA